MQFFTPKNVLNRSLSFDGVSRIDALQVGINHNERAGIAQSVLRLATGWTVRGSNPGRGEILRTRSDRPWGSPNLLYTGYRVFAGGKAAGAWR